MDSTRALAKLGVVFGVALCLSALPPRPAPAADFIRGDVNGDGVVSLADSHFLLRALSHFGPRPECLKTADADHNEQVDGADARRIFHSLFDGDAPLPAPYPAPGPAGPDEGMEGWLDCDAYGNGEPLEDPVAELEITDSVAAGGANNLATVVISLSSSRPLAGFSGTVSIDPRILGPTKPQEALPLSFALDSGEYNSARAKDGLLTFGLMTIGQSSPPRRNVTACEITFCLKEGTKAGSYPIELVAGELVDAETGRSIRPPLAGGTLTVESDVAPGQGCSSDPSAVQFLRGDANGDRRVSIADVHALALWLFEERVPLECHLSGDIDNDAFIVIHDVLRAWNHVLFGHDSLPSPFPQPGPDDGNNDNFGYGSYPCDSYGGGSALEDPEARIAVLDAVAQGGFDNEVKLRIAFSSSRPVAGSAGAIRSDPGVLAPTVTLRADPLPADLDSNARAVSSTADGRIVFALVLDPTGYDSIPAGHDVELLEVTACIAPGTPAGDYPLQLAEGELADFETGRAILPVLRGGTLRLLSDVLPGVSCASDRGMPPPRWKLPSPETVNARFELEDAIAAPGSEAAVSFRMSADAEIQGFSFSVDFDEDMLESMGVETLFEVDPNGWMFFDMNNQRQTPGQGGVDEGHVIGVVSLGGTGERYLPPLQPHEVLRLRFKVREDVAGTSSELRFLDGGKGGPGAAIDFEVRNAMVAHRRQYYPETASSFIFANGRVNVLPDISTFIRGDSNGDAKVDISDPIATLGFLFLGGLRPACYDAADTTDDGQVDLADSIFALNHLFAGDTLPVPAPYPDPGEDPTSDGLGCLYRS